MPSDRGAGVFTRRVTHHGWVIALLLGAVQYDVGWERFGIASLLAVTVLAIDEEVTHAE